MYKYFSLIPQGFHKKIYLMVILNLISVFFETFSLALIPLFITSIFDPSLFEKIPIEILRQFFLNFNPKQLVLYGSISLLIVYSVKSIVSMIIIWFESDLRAKLNYSLKEKFYLLYISSPYEKPVNPEIELDTDKLSVQDCIGKLMSYLLDKNIFEIT